jgi:hypothetical protein
VSLEASNIASASACRGLMITSLVDACTLTAGMIGPELLQIRTPMPARLGALLGCASGKAASTKHVLVPAKKGPVQGLV